MRRDEVIDQILKLDRHDREYVHDLLASSLADNLPPLSQERQTELMRRLEDSRAHPETHVTWEELKKKLAIQRSKNRD